MTSQRILNLAGPSGIGKSHLLPYLAQHDYAPILLTTTRPPRAGEEHGRDYEFLSEEEYRQNILRESSDFFMDNSMLGYHYAVRHSAVQRVWTTGKTPLGTIKLELTRQFTTAYPDTCCIFLTQGVDGLIARRLHQRHPDDEQKVSHRLDAAFQELRDILLPSVCRMFYRVIPIMNDDAESLAAQIHAAVESYYALPTDERVR